MKYTIEYLTDKHIVDIKMEGRINYGIVEKFSKEALKLAREHKCSRFLIDHNSTIINTKTTNIHATGSELQQFGFKNSDKIAVIVKDQGTKNNFEETDNSNTDWSTLKYFFSGETEKAFSWLSK